MQERVDLLRCDIAIGKAIRVGSNDAGQGIVNGAKRDFAARP